MTAGSERDYPDYIERNQKAWSDRDADHAAAMRAKWASEASWGIWDIPEEELRLLPDVDGRDALHIGCGATYVCAWLARRGARERLPQILQGGSKKSQKNSLHLSV